MQSNRAYAMYIIDGKSLKRNPNKPLVYENRISDYDAFLNGAEMGYKSIKEKANSKDTYLVRTSTGNDVCIRYEQLKIKNEIFEVKRRKTGAMVTIFINIGASKRMN